MMKAPAAVGRDMTFGKGGAASAMAPSAIKNGTVTRYDVSAETAKALFTL